MSIPPLRESPLARQHEELGARLIGFAGWRMPIQYEGILPEHHAVRTTCGVFDISHMGQLTVSGGDAARWLNGILTNNITKLDPGHGQYTLMLNSRGGVIDDLIVYRLDADTFFLVVNAAKQEEDLDWLGSHLKRGVDLVDHSADYAGLAIQGPSTQTIAQQVFGAGQPLPERNGIARLGSEIICRTGYTGEDGFEWFMPNDRAEACWQRLIQSGVTPCGLGARDTLRLEMGYPLNGSDLSPDRTPLESGLGFFVDLMKGPFEGRDFLLKQKEVGLPSRLTGLVMESKGPPLRSGYEIYQGGSKLGKITSGCLSPSLGHGIAMAYLPLTHSKSGTAMEVDIRSRRFPIVTAKKPFYHRSSS